MFSVPELVLMDLPQFTVDQPEHRPLIGAHAAPRPGEMDVFPDPSTDAFELLSAFGSRASIGNTGLGPLSRPWAERLCLSGCWPRVC